MDIEALFLQRQAGEGGANHMDIVEHMGTLRALADQVATVVEFGVRTGNSTVAFLASNCRHVISYDIADPQFAPAADVAHKWAFRRADTAGLDFIPACGLLFIDTLHTYAQVKAELEHAGKVARYLVFHDTVNYGGRDEGNANGYGIMSAILEFLATNPEWRVDAHFKNCNGLTVLRRVRAEGGLNNSAQTAGPNSNENSK